MINNFIKLFNSFHGLRQGGLLSSFIFILIMDVLSVMLEAAVDEGFLFGFLVDVSSIGSVNVSHLLFVDNTLISCEPDYEQIHSLWAFYIVLKLFLF